MSTRLTPAAIQEIARAFALASSGTNDECAVCDAGGKRIDYNGYYLLRPDRSAAPDRTEKYKYFRCAWYRVDKRQRGTRSTRESHDLAKAWAWVIDYEQDHKLVIGTPLVRVDPQTLMDGAVQTVQPIVNMLAERAKNASAWRQQKLTRAENLPLSICMAIYYAMRQDIENPDSIKYALQAAVEVWGEDITVKDLEGPAQHAFIDNRRALVDEHGRRVNRDWTIVSYFSIMWTAMRYCVSVAGVLDKAAVQERISTLEWKPRAVLPKRRLRNQFGMNEMGLFLRAAHLRERWWRGATINLGLGPRPRAAQELQPMNVDLEHRTVDLLMVDEDGVWSEQNGVKDRAIVKIGPTMAGWFTFWNAQPKKPWEAVQYMRHLGKQVMSFTWVHAVASHAGVKIPYGFGAYLFRHFIAKYLASHGCPQDQIKALLGHEIADGATTFYVELEPWFLARVAELIEQMFHELDELLPEDMTLLVPHAIEDIPLRGRDATLPMSVWQPDPATLKFDWEAVRERSVWVPDPLPRDRGKLVVVTGAESPKFSELENLGTSWERNPGDTPEA